jgi:hypothetical protein
MVASVCWTGTDNHGRTQRGGYEDDLSKILTSGIVSKASLGRTLSKVEGCEVSHFQLASTELSERENANFDF